MLDKNHKSKVICSYILEQIGSPMKVLISGGTGLVGKELGKALCRQGHKIIVLSRNPGESHKVCPYPHQSVSWEDLQDSPLAKDVDHIVHLAGAGLADRRWDSHYKQTIVNSRVKTTNQLVEFANNNKNIKAFISTSGVGYYGDTKGQWVDETSPVAAGFLSQLCQDWEAPLKNLKHTRGAILRVGVVLSERGGALEKMVPPIQMGFGGPLGHGRQFMSWIDVEDLVNMYIYALENPLEGIFNACAPEAISNKDLTDIIAQHLSKSAFFPVPYLALRMVVGEMAAHLLEDQKVKSDKIQEAGFQFKYANAKDSILQRVPQLKGTERRSLFEQWLPKSKEEIFPFFAEAKNLEQITPDSLNFKILDSSTPQIEKGTIFNYRLKVDGIPLRWRTLITEWNPPNQFVDNQVKGPYKKWHHTHLFEDLAGGTLMTDQVDFTIPFGILGYGAAAWKVTKDVNRIFKYRRDTIYKLYFN
jgi:uncharacterized protein (TIGR01777 family)